MAPTIVATPAGYFALLGALLLAWLLEADASREARGIDPSLSEEEREIERRYS